MRILVVYKKSFLEQHREDRDTLRRLPAQERSRVIRADIENRHAIHDVYTFLTKRRVKFDVVYRGQLAANPLYDLIVTVGGDGTFLTASHHAQSAPILGINSDPRNSLGVFTCADRRTFQPKLERALEGRLAGTRLNRLSLDVNGERVPELVSNDLLFAHPSPAAMSHYSIAPDGHGEAQRSSGVWIATAAGSTAGIRAAGGRRMPIASTRIQYFAREPYHWPVAHGRKERGEARRWIELVVLMAKATIWIDGNRVRYELHLGDRVRVETGASPVIALGFDDRRRRRLFP